MVGNSPFLARKICYCFEGYAMKICAFVLKNLSKQYYLSETTLKDFGILPVEFPHIPADNIVNLRLSNRGYKDPQALRSDNCAQIMLFPIECQKSRPIVLFSMMSSRTTKGQKILMERFNRDGKIYNYP